MFAGMHPVYIAAHCIYLAIVAQVTERLSQRPRWEGVGGKTLMDEGKGGLATIVVQVCKIFIDIAD
jgi:hypothetical protein